MQPTEIDIKTGANFDTQITLSAPRRIYYTKDVISVSGPLNFDVFLRADPIAGATFGAQMVFPNPVYIGIGMIGHIQGASHFRMIIQLKRMEPERVPLLHMMSKLQQKKSYRGHRLILQL
jgi:hypothetical protein